MITTIQHQDNEFYVVDGEAFQYRCNACNYWHSPARSEELLRGGLVGSVFNCDNCGRVRYRDEDISVSMLQSASTFLNIDATKKARWFHATTVQDWHKSVLDADDPMIMRPYYPEGADLSIFVHIGTLDAALDRAVALDDKSVWYIHEIEILDDAEIAPNIVADHDSSAPNHPADVVDEKNDGEDRGYSVRGITRYLNRFENPGSVSLLAHPTTFQVVETTVIS